MSWRVRAGLVMFRFRGGELEVFLARPGVPTAGAEEHEEWVIPKGGQKNHESLLQAAQREFQEEVGILPRGPFLDLGSVRQNNGKAVHVWAFQGDWDETQKIRSALHEVEWPPGSGQLQTFPEMAEGRFFPIAQGRQWLRSSQRPFLDRLAALVHAGAGSSGAAGAVPGLGSD